MHRHGGHKNRGKHKHGKHGHGAACAHMLGKHKTKHPKGPIGRFSREPASRLNPNQHGVQFEVKPLPEGRVSDGMARVEARRCKACGKCIQACPSGAIEVNHEAAEVNQELCVGCGACLDACPTGAIRFS